METINALQLSFLFDCSKQAAIYDIYKCNNKLDDLDRLKSERSDLMGKIKLLKSDYLGAEVLTSKMSVYKDIDIKALIKSINEDFTHSWECCQYLLKRMLDKYKPNDKSGLYPIALSLPVEVSSLMNDEGRQKCLKWLEKNFTGYMNDIDGNRIPIIFKI